MRFDLYTNAALSRDFPEHRLCRGDVVEYRRSSPVDNRESAYSIEVFNAVGDTIGVTAVLRSALKSPAAACPPGTATSNRCFQFHKRSQFSICAHDETRSIAMRVNLWNQKKLSCVWIFHDRPGRKISDIDILVLFRQIRTCDHTFPAWDRNSIGETSFCFFYIRG